MDIHTHKTFTEDILVIKVIVDLVHMRTTEMINKITILIFIY